MAKYTVCVCMFFSVLTLPDLIVQGPFCCLTLPRFNITQQRVSESLETEDKWEQKKGRKGSSSTQDHLLCRWSGRLEYVRRYRSCLLDSLSREAEELRLLRQSQATALSACLLGLMHPSLSFSLVLGRRPAEDKQSNSTLLSRAGRAMTNLSLKHQPLRNRSATEGALGIGSSQFYPFSLPLTLAQVHELASEDIDSAEVGHTVRKLYICSLTVAAVFFYCRTSS